MMNCEQIQDQLVPLLLEELSASDQRIVQAHLDSGCPDCQAAWRCLSEATELLYLAVPSVPLSASQQRTIVRTALQANPGGTRHNRPSWAPVAAEEFSPIRESFQPFRLLQALLAVAAGFLVMLTAQAWWSVVSQPALNALADRSGQSWGQTADAEPQLNVASGSCSGVHFVSMTIHTKAAQPIHAGYFVADRFSGELHVLGNISRIPHSDEQFRLIVGTSSGQEEYPVSVDQQGRFKLILSIPDSQIRELSLVMHGP